MSNLNDEAVFDFFSTLLTEDMKQKAPECVYASDQKMERKLKISEDNARLNKQALSALLSPVLSTDDSIDLSLDKSLKPTPVFSNKQGVSQYEENKLKKSERLMINRALVKENNLGVDMLCEAVSDRACKGKVETVYKDRFVASHSAVLDVKNKDINIKGMEKSVGSSGHVLFEQLDDEFQVLFFELAGLTLAVPLVELGGIVNIKRVSTIVGRPRWYLGMQEHRGSQINVIDTCSWVMPEKVDTLAQAIEYKYIALLGQSQWGLAFNRVVKTNRLKKSQVQWRQRPGKRPWLAGVVKQQMCGIIDVQTLICMLNQDVSCQKSN